MFCSVSSFELVLADISAIGLFFILSVSFVTEFCGGLQIDMFDACCISFLLLMYLSFACPLSFSALTILLS
jgi:hypothetical protein